MSWLFELNKVHNWAYWENAFTPDECEQIIQSTIENNELKEGMIGGGIFPTYNPEYRKNNVIFLNTNDNTNWIYERFAQVITNLNEQYFGFDLYGMTEDLQFSQYNTPGEFYDKHLDSSMGTPPRKLTAVLQLSDPKSYDDCELLLHIGEPPERMPKDQGKIIVFPSYTLHQVTPITRGTRYSLVSWVSGPSFK